MKQIVFVTISMAGGGTERVISILANYYIEAGYGVTILMIGGDEVAYELSDKIDLRQISAATNGSLLGRLERIKSLRNSIREYNSPYVIAMGTVASMFTSFATIGVNCNLILSERNDPNRLNHRPIKKVEMVARNLLYRRADKIVFQTNMALECFPTYIRKNGRIVSNPLSQDIPPYNTNTGRDKRIVYAGRLSEQKNPLLLLDAFARLHEVHPEYTLEYYGQGELKDKIVSKITEYNLEDTARVCGYSKELYSILQASEIYVSCSNWEGVSNSLIEAAALGNKIIATDCPMGGSRMVVEEISFGILTTMNSDDAIYQALITHINNEYPDTAREVKSFREHRSVSAIAMEWIR